MNKIILSPSYFIIILFFLIYYDRKYASYFYPYVLYCSIVGIFMILVLIFDKKKRKLVKKYFPSNITNYFTGYQQILCYLFIIVIKIILILYWPFNISIESIKKSFYFFIFYLICLCITYYI